ncbi:hypothetical protein WJX73_009687 [Symbiochloris irregularis]|uniref:RING-type E3 ubiquitin transferase (cysteine targeting) n=1 Tax=Symbiochloris irregularis TaxID=706552 RepID=A0AAW1P7R3_9CHLO
MEGAGGFLPVTPPAEQWQVEWTRALPELDALTRARKKPLEAVIMRASQLDASRLDSELTAMLKEQFMTAFSLFQQRVVSAFQPELTLLLDFLIFRYSVWAGKPTPGTALMNLRYRNEASLQGGKSAALADPTSAHAPMQQAGGRTGVEGPGLGRTQTLLYGMGMVLVRYIWTRADLLASKYQWGEQVDGPAWAAVLWKGMRWTETAFKLGSLLNFFVFLQQGRYRSLLERVLSIRLVYTRASMARALSFEYLNRQLVWHELSELLLFALPLLNIQAIKRLVSQCLPPRTLSRRPATVAASDAPGAGVESERSASAQGLQAASVQPCSFCNTAEVALPYSALPCQHRYCYFCLRSQTSAADVHVFNVCGQLGILLGRTASLNVVLQPLYELQA